MRGLADGVYQFRAFKKRHVPIQHKQIIGLLVGQCQIHRFPHFLTVLGDIHMADATGFHRIKHNVPEHKMIIRHQSADRQGGGGRQRGLFFGIALAGEQAGEVIEQLFQWNTP